MSAAGSVAGPDLTQIRFHGLTKQAISAIDDLWEPGAATFWRDSAQREADKTPQGFHPTATLRCSEQVLSLDDKGEPAADRRHAMIAAVAGVPVSKLTKPSILGYRPFTFALAVATTAKIASSESDCAKTAKVTVNRLAPGLKRELRDVDQIHPFVRFHAIRALELARDHLPAAWKTDRKLRVAEADTIISELRATIRADTRNLLANHHTGLISPAEHVVLAFCAAALSATSNRRDGKLALAALRAAVAAQDSAGSWPLGRVVRTEPSRLEISTYEVAWAVASTLKRLLTAGICGVGSAEAEELSAAVARAGLFAERSTTELDTGLRGWASDHPYEKPRVESWTSAIVLEFGRAAEDLRYEVGSRRVLASFSVSHPKDDDWPSHENWDGLKKQGELEADYPILEYIEKNILRPILDSPNQLPSASERCVSALLFGPPGTSKTTIVKSVAHALQWPVVSLSPGTFIKRGMEAIEAEASSVFDGLRQLRRVVVLFDECDELFRDRERAEGDQGARNISSFVTASMLPKLQDLHDRGRVLFFICTNYVSVMDAAVRRPGRIDHRIGVGPPDPDARERILKEGGVPAGVGNAAAAIRGLAKDAHRFSRSELGRAKKELLVEPGWETPGDATLAAERIVERMERSITITERMAADFAKHKQDFGDVPEKEVTA